MAVLDLPLVRLAYQTPFLRRACRSAGTSIIGREQMLTNGTRHWELEIGVVIDWERDRIKAFEAFMARLECTDIIKVPFFDQWGYDARRAPLQQPFSDGTWFSDGTGWLASGTSVQPVVVAAGVAAGGNELTINTTDPVQPAFDLGDYFSHNGYLYQVTGRTAAGWTRFSPRARAAIPAAAVLDTAPAYFYGRPDDKDFGKRGRGVMSMAPAVALKFVEALDR